MSEKSRPGCDALRVQVQRDVDQVDVAGALAVAEQAALDAVGAGHQREFAGRRAGAAVVVRMHREHDRVAPRQMAMHPLDHVGEDVRRAVLDGRRQVDDALALGRRLPRPRSPHRPRAWRTPARCRRTSRANTGRRSRSPAAAPPARGSAARASAARSTMPSSSSPSTTLRITGAVALYRCTMARLAPLQRLEGAADQRLARLRQHLDRHVVGHRSSSMSLRTKSKSVCDAEGKPTSISLKPIAHQRLEHAQLALRVHRLDQRLVAVAQVDAAARAARGVRTASGQCGRAGRRAGRLGTWLAGFFNMDRLCGFSVVRATRSPKEKRPAAGCIRAVELEKLFATR